MQNFKVLYFLIVVCHAVLSRCHALGEQNSSVTLFYKSFCESWKPTYEFESKVKLKSGEGKHAEAN